MQADKGPEKIGDLLATRKTKKPPTFAWQELALRVIKDLNVPDFKRNSVFKTCKQNSYARVLIALNDTKELCRDGQKWKYFFKIIEAKA